jgi:hypothetical protein
MVVWPRNVSDELWGISSVNMSGLNREIPVSINLDDMFDGVIEWTKA